MVEFDPDSFRYNNAIVRNFWGLDPKQTYKVVRIDGAFDGVFLNATSEEADVPFDRHFFRLARKPLTLKALIELFKAPL